MAAKWFSHDGTGYLTALGVSYPAANFDDITICAEVVLPSSGYCRICLPHVSGGASKWLRLSSDNSRYLYANLKDGSGVVKADAVAPTQIPASTATRVIARYSGGANGTVYVGFYDGTIREGTAGASSANWPGSSTIDKLDVGYNTPEAATSPSGFKIAHVCVIDGDIGDTASDDFLTNGTSPLSLGGTALHYFYDSLTAHTGSGTFSEGAATVSLADTPTSTVDDPPGGASAVPVLMMHQQRNYGSA